MKRFLLALVLLCGLPAQAATTYHFCKCDTGADPLCAAGNDTTGNGLSSATAWRTETKAQTMMFGGTVQAGDSLLACRGGHWAGATGFTITANYGGTTGASTKANPFTFGAYTPHWGGAGAKPKFTFTNTGSGSGLYLSGAGRGNQYGLIVRDMNFVGTNHSSMNGITFAYNWGDVTVDNMTIDSFFIGINSSNWGSSGIGAAVVRNSSILNNRNQGMLVGQRDLLVENNTFDNNGSCIGGVEGTRGGCNADGGRHTFYVAGGTETHPQRNVTFRGNTITRNAYTNGLCEGTIVTGHGVLFSYLVENNYINMAASGGGCYGIGYSPNPYDPGSRPDSKTEGVRDFVARGNTVINVPYGVNCNGCLRAVFENNVLISTNGVAPGLIAISGSANTNPAQHLQTSQFTIRNNSIYVASGSGAAVELSTLTGTGNVVVNNLIYIAAGSTMNCWSYGSKTASDFAEFDYNLCYNLGSGSTVTPTSTNSHSLTSNPLLRTVPPISPAWDMQIQTTSPAKNGGTTSGRGARLAYKDYPAVGTRDIGAYEFGGNP